MTEPVLTAAPAADEIKTTTCYMCACRCGIRVHLKDGRIRYIQGNREHPVNRGVLCAKGSAGIMQQYSPAKLRKPLKRVGPRGSGEFVEIEWDEAMALASSRLAGIRQRNPNELAFFTGRDQSQALTGWWAQQFGTVNYAAHGGFCSVNMAAGGLYSIGGSFWEFGEPDWEHTRYLMMWGVAEDHDSNPIKLGLGKLKGRGAKVVAINPVRTGYAAIADEWVPIRPGTDGLLVQALIHELLKGDRIDLDYLVRYGNAHWLVIDDPGAADDGLFARDASGQPLCATRQGGEVRLVDAGLPDISPQVVGEFTLADGRSAQPVFAHIARRYLDPACAPEAVSERCGVPVETIRRLARELAEAAFDQAFELAQPWTDVHGREHASMPGRPVSMHAMRGISAHSNGFHTCRGLHLLQLLLGTIDVPGGFRYQAPFPRPAPPANRPGRRRNAQGVLDAAPLGFVHGPEDLLVGADGTPERIDHAYSWAYPLAAHGMMHTVIRNAWAGDPYRIDTLMMFMANMSWNSAMNTAQTQQWLSDVDPDSGEYKIPYIIYCDAFASEMVSYADLVLPDTTYLERWDCISLLDRPISDADGVSDSIRQPVLEPDRDVRAFQSMLLDLGARLGLPGMVDEDGLPRYPGGYPDYMVNHQRQPGIGLLAGWRGEDGASVGRGAPNPEQLQRYVANGCFWHQAHPPRQRYYKMANRDYLSWSQQMGFIPGGDDPPRAIVHQLYSEVLQRFRLAARGHGKVQPPDDQRARVERYFDPLPIWYEPLEMAATAGTDLPLSAITQRPMFMYHSWGSQNAWLRQIASRNALYMHPDLAAKHGIADGDWVELTSHHGVIIVEAALHASVQPDTVWTWNAIGKRRGAWALDDKAPEARRGFLLNHLISDKLPAAATLPGERQTPYANADPVTGQAAWFDLRVAIRRAPEQQREASEPEFVAQPRPAGLPAPPWQLRFGAAFRQAAARREKP